MHEVFQCSLCLFEQETQTNPLRAPQQGLVFVRSDDVIYGGPGFNIIFVHTWPSGISWGCDRHETVDHCLRLKRRTKLLLVFWQVSWKCGMSWYCFVVADWHIRVSGGLAINRNPQFFTTFIVKSANVMFNSRVWCYIISSELVYIA